MSSRSQPRRIIIVERDGDTARVDVGVGLSHPDLLRGPTVLDETMAALTLKKHEDNWLVFRYPGAELP